MSDWDDCHHHPEWSDVRGDCWHPECVQKVTPSVSVSDHAEVIRQALAGVRTHNGTPVTPKNLRWAATHEALCRSYIFDVLNGLADALEGKP